jgi:hypothetical protein
LDHNISGGRKGEVDEANPETDRTGHVRGGCNNVPHSIHIRDHSDEIRPDHYIHHRSRVRGQIDCCRPILERDIKAEPIRQAELGPKIQGVHKYRRRHLDVCPRKRVGEVYALPVGRRRARHLHVLRIYTRRQVCAHPIG